MGDFAGASALLLGTGTHGLGSDLPDIPAVARTLTDLRDALLARCGLAEVRLELDLRTPMELGAALSSAAASATGPLIVYYVGHGLLSRRGALHLAAADTGSGALHLEHTALPYDLVRRYLLDNVEGPFAVILDCCFSGRAIEGMSGPLEEVAGLAEITGAYVLTSAGRSEPSFAPAGMGHTAFSGALLRLLADGDPACPPLLTLQDVHRHLSRVLPAGGFPRPRARSTGRVGELVLARNPAHVTAPDGVRLSPVGVPAGSPYKGLAAFSADDAALFFGRGRLVAQLVRQLADRFDDPAPLIVTGASGSGKSSLLRAGLLPALRQGALGIPGSADWPVAVITPADAVPDSAGVLIVDQFEEAFVQGPPGFVERVLAHPGLVVLGVRADFLGRCASHPGLQPALERGQLVVGPMSAAELREAIERPAAAVGLTLEPGLPDLLLADLGESPGGLPLLSHALLATWQQRSGATLTVAGYRATGGIHGALAATADDVLASLGDAETARGVFRRLVHVGEGADDSRRRVDLDRLLAELADPLAACTVLDAFAADDARLITIDGSKVAITHEALLRAWPVLRGWIDSDRAGLLVEQHLVEAAHAWESSGRDPSALYRGTRLEIARDRAGPELTREFLRASEALERAEAAAARRRNRRRVVLSGVLSGLLVLALIATAVAVQKYREADRQQRVAAGLGFIYRADSVRAADPRAAIEWGIAAVHANPGVETESALAAEVLATPYRGRLAGHGRTVTSVAFSPDGRRALSGGWDGRVLLWDVSDVTRPVRTAELPSGETVWAVRFTPDGRGAVVVRQGAAPELWDLAASRLVERLGNDRALYGAAVQQGGSLLALAGDEGTELWDLSGKARSLVRVGPPARRVAISGELLLAARPDGSAQLYRLGSGRTPVEVGEVRVPGDSAPAVALSDDGGLAVVADRVIDLRFFPGQQPLATITGHGGEILDAAFVPGTRLLVTGGADRIAMVWDLTRPAEPAFRARLEGHRDRVVTVAARAGGAIVTGSGDTTGISWQFGDPGRGELPGMPVEPVGAVTDTAGTRLLTWDTEDGGATLWALGAASAPTVVSRYGRVSGGVALSADGRAVLVGRTDGAELRGKVIAAGLEVRSVSLSDDGGVALVGGRSGAVVRHGESETWLARGVAVSAVGLSADGRLGLVASGGAVTPWDLTDPSRPRAGAVMAGHVDTVLSIEVYGDAVLTGGMDKKALLWSIEGPADVRARAPLLGHTEAVATVRFSADGRFALTGGFDETVGVWLVTDRARPHRVATLPRTGYAADFGPGRYSVVTGDTLGGMSLWSLPRLAETVGAPLRTACELIHDNGCADRSGNG